MSLSSVYNVRKLSKVQILKNFATLPPNDILDSYPLTNF